MVADYGVDKYDIGTGFGHLIAEGITKSFISLVM